MKKILVLLSALIIISCKKEETSGHSVSDAISSVQTLNKMGNATENIEKRGEELKKTAPVSNDEFKTAVPETLLGMSRKELSLGETSMMEMNSATARYHSENGNEITLIINDGAGEMGSSLYTLTKLGLAADVEKQNEYGWQKTMDIAGNKSVVEEEEKNADFITSKITFIAKDRYLISLNTQGLTVEELKKAVSEINFNTLL